MRKFCIWFFSILAGFVCFLLVLLLILRFESPSLFSRSALLARLLSDAVHQPVSIKGSALRWEGATAVIHINKITLSSKLQPSMPVLTGQGIDVRFNVWHVLKQWRWVLDALHWDSFQAVASVNSHRQVQLGYPQHPLLLSETNGQFTLSQLPLSKSTVLSLQNSDLTIYGLFGRHAMLQIPEIKLSAAPNRQFLLKWRLGDRDVYQEFSSDCVDSPGKTSVCTAHANLKGLDIKPLLVLFAPQSFSVKKALIDAQSDWVCTQQHCTGGIQQLSLVSSWLGSQKKLNQLQIRRASGILQREKNGWSLPINWPSIVLNKAQVRGFKTVLAFHDKREGRRLSITIPTIDLQKWCAVIQAGLPDNQAKWLSKLAPTGQVNQVSWVEVLSNPKQSVLSAALDDVGFHQSNELPGMTHLSATLRYQPGVQKVVIRPKLKQASLYWPTFLPARLSAMNLTGVIRLLKNRSGWQLHMQRLQYHDAHSRLNLDGLIRFGPQFNHPFFDFSSDFSIADLRYFKHYLPYPMPHHTRVWLVRGFLGGHTTGKIVWNGPLKGFPYLHNEGRWLLSAGVKNLKLYYSPGWPVLNHAEGKLIMKNSSLSFSSPSAVLSGNPLRQASGYIPNVNHPILYVKGHSHTQMQTVQHFLTLTPLPWGKELSGVQFSGPVDIDIDLNADVSIKHGPVHLKGGLALHDAKVYMTDWDIEMSKINGDMHFTEKGLTGRNVHATIFSSPAVAQINTTELKKGGTALQLAIAGKLQMEALYKQLPFAILKFFHGTTQYKANLMYGKSLSPAKNRLEMESSLRGIQVDLPGKFKKSASASLPMTVGLQLTNKKPFDVNLRYGQLLNAMVRLKQEKKHTTFESGEIFIGVKKISLPKAPGLVLKAHFDDVDLQQWLPVISVFYHEPGNVDLEGRRHGVKWRALDLNFNHFLWGKIDFSRFRLSLAASEKDWRFQLFTAFGQGVLSIPRVPKTIYRLALKHFEWKKFLNTGIKNLAPIKKTSIDQFDLPKAQVTCDQCSYGSNHFGWIALLYNGQGSTGKTMNITWKNQGMAMHSLLTWGKTKQTELAGLINFSDLGTYLKQYVHTPFVKGGSGDIHFSLNWPHKPFIPTLTNISGFFRLRLKDLRFIHLPKKVQSGLGIAKLINVLSVQNVLPLFGVIAKGFHVDALSFSVHFKKEVFTTHDLKLKSAIMNAFATGSVDLLSKALDIHLTVEPQVTGSLPIIATIAGGPVVGLFAYLLNKVVEPMVGKAAALHYTIKGHLSDPLVTKSSK